MYIKYTEYLKPIAEGYKQTFQNRFTSSVSRNEVIKMKNEGKITDRDLVIAKFLFKFKFATIEQIYQYLKLEDVLTKSTNVETNEDYITSLNSIKIRVEKLVQNRILNKFMLSVIEDEKIHQDALVIYCLDLGGKFLLTNYSNEDTTDWYVSVNLKSSELVSKELFTTQFYLRLRETCGDEKLVYFETNPIRRCEKNNIIPSFDFALNHNGVKKYFIGEVTREFDIPNHFHKKMIKLERLLETNSWKKYYYDTDTPPIVFLFAESDLLALDLARIMDTTTIDRYRISTDERINGDLSTAFMSYTSAENKLKLVKSSILSK